MIDLNNLVAEIEDRICGSNDNAVKDALKSLLDWMHDGADVDGSYQWKIYNPQSGVVGAKGSK